MTDKFAEAMRQSLDLVRASNPAEATRLIQQALSGETGGAGPIAPDRETAAPSQRRPLSEVLAGLAQKPGGTFTPPNTSRPAVEVPATMVIDAARHDTPHGARDYRVFRPADADLPVRGLILMLHGCTQTPEDFAKGTQMHMAAAQKGMIVVYPEQGRSHNTSLCWNWFRPSDQAAQAGEPAILADLAAHVAAKHGVPKGRVFAAGLSAGGAMAAILAQTHRDLFRAVGIHSGLPTGVAHDVVSAFGAMRGEGNPRGAAVPSHCILFQGSADTTVAPVNAGRLAGVLTATTERSGTAGGRRFDVLTGRNATGHSVELWRIDGAGHAWSGGARGGSFADPAGPDASTEMVRFFDALT